MGKGTTKEDRQIRAFISQTRSRLHEENQKFEEDKMVRLAADAWPDIKIENPPREVWRSRGFFLMVFDDKNGHTRLSICRSQINDAGQWVDDISWDELFMLKCSVGFEHQDVVEIFPAVADYVNVSNMRHLWVMDEPITYKWAEKQVQVGDDVGECALNSCDGRCIKTPAATECQKCGKVYNW